MANQALAQILPLLAEVAVDLADGKIDEQEKAALLAHGLPLVQAFILTQISKPAAPPAPEQPAVPAPVAVPPAPAPVPVPATPVPAPPPAEDWTVDEIDAEIMFFEGDRDGGDAEERGIRGKLYPADGSHVQMVGERAHLSFTPKSRGRKVPDEIVRTWYMADGHSPMAQPRWLLNGKMQWNSTDEPDHFELQAYDRKSSPNAGWTIVLLLTRQAGPGQGRAEAYQLLPGQFNNGHEVTSRSVSWQTD